MKLYKLNWAHSPTPHWYARFKMRPSALRAPNPPALLERAYGLPQQSRCWPM